MPLVKRQLDDFGRIGRALQIGSQLRAFTRRSSHRRKPWRCSFATVGPNVPLVTSPTIASPLLHRRSLAGDAFAFQLQAHELALRALALRSSAAVRRR